MTALAADTPQQHLHKMPEFEDNSTTSNQTQSYTPSTDAAKKPRTRRRSGGFKTEVSSASKGNMGPVDPAEALTNEKLSGTGKPANAPEKSEELGKPRAPRNESKPKEEQQRKERVEKSEAPTPNPQPSPETLAAIAKVEARLAERKAERDARRAEREKNRPAKKKAAKKKPHNAIKGKRQAKGGLLAAITGFFGGLFGSERETQKKKPSGNRGGKNRRGGQNRGKGGQNRGHGGKGGQGQNRRRGGKGGGQKRHSAASLSNES